MCSSYRWFHYASVMLLTGLGSLVKGSLIWVRKVIYLEKFMKLNIKRTLRLIAYGSEFFA